jgi:hypothetical protein
VFVIVHLVLDIVVSKSTDVPVNIRPAKKLVRLLESSDDLVILSTNVKASAGKVVLIPVVCVIPVCIIFS